MEKFRKICIALIFVSFPMFVGFIGSLGASNAREIYAELLSPAFSPPSFIFPIMWTVLYLLMGIASYLVFAGNGAFILKSSAMKFYFIQLFVNSLWTLFFFALGWRLFALVWLVLLLFLLVLTMIKFRVLSKAGFYLLVPYFLWVSFAGYLNLGFWLLNR